MVWPPPNGKTGVAMPPQGAKKKIKMYGFGPLEVDETTCKPNESGRATPMWRKRKKNVGVWRIGGGSATPRSAIGGGRNHPQALRGGHAARATPRPALGVAREPPSFLFFYFNLFFHDF
jgi:hypothetical protein